jgi:hypothetical protein
MRVLVCGGRDYNDIRRVWNVLSELQDEKGITDLIHGDAKGADSLAAFWGYHTFQKNGDIINVHRYPADWEGEGKKAGYLRNKRMLDEGKPDYVVAFPGGKGTTNMVQLAAKAGIPCISIDNAPTAIGMALECH